MIEDVMDRALSQLVQYISQQLEQGIPESTIRESLAVHGWTPEWIEDGFRETKRYAETNHPTLPSPLSPKSTPGLSSIETSRPQIPWKPILLVIAVATLIGLAIIIIPLIAASIAKPKLERAQHDLERKHNLNIILTDLADYYVANKKYPTLDELTAADFSAKNPDFDTKAAVDPQWSISQKACTKDKKAVFAKEPTVGCYAYMPTTSEGQPCNNSDKSCTRMKIIVMLEKDNTPYSITLDQNTQK